MCETFDQHAVVQNFFLILVLERIREQLDFFQGSRENEKLQGSKKEKMQGAREKIRREQGEWTKIRREQGARTPPLRVSTFCLSSHDVIPYAVAHCQACFKILDRQPYTCPQPVHSEAYLNTL